MEKKKLKLIELVSTASALISKLLLAFDSILGWPFAIVGYVLVAFYNFIRKDTLLASTVIGLSAMCAYGWYKWSVDLTGLFPVDYLIIFGTASFALIIYIRSARKSGLMGHLQGLVTISTLTAFILLGYKMLLGGWIALFISHTILAYFYKVRMAKWYVFLQIVSMIISGLKIFEVLAH